MLVALIDRIRSLDNEIIRQDTLIKTILGVPQLIDSNKIAMADLDGKDRYLANKWEKKAENWAQQEYRKKWKNNF